MDTTVIDMQGHNDDSGSESLMQLWKNHYYRRGRSPKNLIMSNRFATRAFWYVALTLLYSCTVYGIPFVYAGSGAWTVYCLQVFFTFVAISVIVNWIFCRSRDSTYYSSGDFCRTVHGQNGRANGDIRENSDMSDWCSMCKHIKPLRCHHCPDCNKCILKRDHHCYMVGVCIGFKNERHFIVFSFYVAIYCLFGLYVIIKYMNVNTFPNITYTDLFLPKTVVKLMFGNIKLHEFFMISHCYFLWWAGPLSVSFVCWQMFTVITGKTSHEVRKDLDVKCLGSVAENIRLVFGEYWLLNFVFPAHMVFKQTNDGIIWPNVVYKSQKR